MTPVFEFYYQPCAVSDASRGELYLRISHRGKTRFLATPYAVCSGEWNAFDATIISHASGGSRRRTLERYAAGMARDLRLLGEIATGLGAARRRFSVDDIVADYTKVLAGMKMLGVFAEFEIEDLKLAGRVRLGRSYASAVRRFTDFNGGADIDMGDVTRPMVDAFRQRLEAEGMGRGTVLFHLRVLRTIYNKAERDGVIARGSASPFDAVFENNNNHNLPTL